MMKDLEDEIDKESAHVDIEEVRTTKQPEDEGEAEAAHLEKVRHRAYLLWESDGEPHGKDQDYWFQAEREIAEEEGDAPSSAPRLVP